MASVLETGRWEERGPPCKRVLWSSLAGSSSRSQAQGLLDKAGPAGQGWWENSKRMASVGIFSPNSLGWRHTVFNNFLGV